MRLVIDVGNSHTVFGLWEDAWEHVWRMKTDPQETEDQLASFYFGLAREGSENWRSPQRILCASVVPSLSDAISMFGSKWFDRPVEFLTAATVPNLEIRYSPPTAVGADRLANAVAAKALGLTPAIIVDFGTATTFDAVGKGGEYLGGSILPGPVVAMEALFDRAAKLPKVELAPPKNAIGRTTTESLQSGLVLGYAGAIDNLARRMKDELPEARVVATGGLAGLFAPLCEEVESVEPMLTLDGIRLAFEN
jgi:type III pantothenate kinase